MSIPHLLYILFFAVIDYVAGMGHQSVEGTSEWCRCIIWRASEAACGHCDQILLDQPPCVHAI